MSFCRPYDGEDLDGDEYEDEDDEDRSRESSANRDNFKPEMTEERRAKLREIEVELSLCFTTYTRTCTVDSPYNAVLFSNNTHNRSLIARP